MNLNFKNTIILTTVLTALGLFSQKLFANTTPSAHKEASFHQKQNETHTLKYISLKECECLHSQLNHISDAQFRWLAFQLYGVIIENKNKKWMRIETAATAKKQTISPKKTCDKTHPKKKEEESPKEPYLAIFSNGYNPENSSEWHGFPKLVNLNIHQKPTKPSRTKRIAKKTINICKKIRNKFRRKVKRKNSDSLN